MTTKLPIEDRSDHYASLMENTPDVITRWNKDLKLIYANHAFELKTGIPNLTLLGKDYCEMGQPEEIALPYMAGLRKAIDSVEIVEHVHRFLSPQGEFHFSSRLIPERNGRGEVESVLGIGRDITDLKKTQEEIVQVRQELARRTYDKYHTLYKMIDEGFCIVEILYDVQGQPLDFRYLDVNPAFEKQTGLKVEVGKTFRHYRPDAGSDLFERYADVDLSRTARRFSNYSSILDRWYELYAAPFGEPEAHQIIILFNDITERKQAETALRSSQQRLQRVLETDAVGVIFFDAEGVLIEANDVFLRMTSYTRDQIERRELSWRTLTPPEWLAESQAQMERFHQTGRVGPYEKEYFLADGSRSWMLFAGRDVGDGTIAEYCININDRKQMEKALRENQEQLQALNQTLEQKIQEKTAEVRRLASDLIKATQRERQRISHVLHDDLQQRIYAIQMQLTFMHDSLHDESARSEASAIKKELDDILKITRHLSIDLSPPILRGEGLSQAVHWLAGRMQQQYELPIEVQATEAFVIPDEELHVLLFNCVRELLFNVVKHAEAHRAVVILEWIEGGLRIEVHDDGKGLPPENLAASGAQAKSLPPTIGLPAIHHQLSLFGGSLDISSQAGSGTLAILRVPLHRGT